MIIIDIIVLGIILLSVFLGYKKGLIGALFQIISFFLAILITLFLYKPVTTYIIEHTNIDEQINNIIIEKLSFTNIDQGEKINEDETNLPKVVVNYIHNGIENTISETEENILPTIANSLTENIINIISILGIFLIL